MLTSTLPLALGNARGAHVPLAPAEAAAGRAGGNAGRHGHAVAAAALALVLGTGGAPAQTSAGMPDRVTDTVLVGCAGGETGAGSGNLLTGDGWRSGYVSQLHTGRTYTPFGRDSAATAAVFAELERIRFRRIRYEEPANMTCVLELRDEAGEHWVAWPMGRPPAVIEPVLEAFDRAVGEGRRGGWRK